MSGTSSSNAVTGHRVQKEHLEWSNDGIEQIDKTIFSTYDPETLTIIHMNDNRIKSIPANTFILLKNLLELHLHRNEIESIYKASFKGLFALKELYLNQNKIKMLAANTFVELQALEKLNLRRNEIDKLDETTFNGLGGLKELGISENKIKAIPLNTFHQLKQLESLWIDEHLVNKRLLSGFETLQTINGK
jgi:Leucine-rich repeat (LRR) protein